MRHRGPDDHGRFLEQAVGLGFVRLSILDLSAAGHQPMESADGRFVIVYNGEVYNYLELRKDLEKQGFRFRSGTDTEVVLNAYVHWGLACLDRLNGMFAFAIYDRWERGLVLARDRFGVKPLYYTVLGGRLAFASEIGPLLALLPRQNVLVNEQMVFDYLVHERVDHTEETFFQGIQKLRHGCWMKVEQGELQLSRWYCLQERVGEESCSSQDYLDILESAVGLTLRSDVALGVALSGGLDSSSIVALLLHRHGLRDIHTFSAVYGPGVRGDESSYIREFAPHLANMSFTTPTATTLLEDLGSFVQAHQEPVPRTGPYAQFKVMQRAGGQVKVMLEGQGADEVLAGYKSVFGFHYRGLLARGQWAAAARELWAVVGEPGGLGSIGSFLYCSLPRWAQDLMVARQKRVVGRDFYGQFAAASRVHELLLSARDLKGALIDMMDNKLEHLLKWGDRNSMWFSIESRVPFLDHRLVERTVRLPAQQILKDGMSKYILREAMQGLLPERIRVRRDKVGFGTPENDWLRAPAFEALVREILTSDFYRHHPYIDTKIALESYERHLRGRCHIARQIWKWINLYFWHRQCVDSSA